MPPVPAGPGALRALLPVSCLLAACEAAQPGAARPATPEPHFTLTAEQTHNRFSAAIAPVLRVPSGAVIEAYTKEASDGQLHLDSTTDDLWSLDFDPIHPLTGPVYVEGALPGDVLAVTLHRIEVGEWGWTAVIPGFGFLADEITGPFLRTFELGPDATEVVFNERMRIPLRPFAGVMGVAPATDSALSTIPPRANGGNMDNRHLVEGVTVYFPVFVEGALFSIGDGHAAQGDGEVAGTGIEVPLRVVYEVNVLEGEWAMAEPQYESGEIYGVTAYGTTLEEAAMKATRYMIDYLVRYHGLTRTEAYALASLAADLKISEVVDMPHVLVSMHIPKAVLGTP